MTFRKKDTQKEKKKYSHLRVVGSPEHPQRHLELIEGGKKDYPEGLRGMYHTLKEGAHKYRKPLCITALSVAGIAVSCLGYGKLTEIDTRAETIYPVGDLNGDRVPDFVVVQADGHKVPLYCVSYHKDMCVSGIVMKREFNLFGNYEGIEKKLNER